MIMIIKYIHVHVIMIYSTCTHAQVINTLNDKHTARVHVHAHAICNLGLTLDKNALILPVSEGE